MRVSGKDFDRVCGHRSLDVWLESRKKVGKRHLRSSFWELIGCLVKLDSKGIGIGWRLSDIIGRESAF